MTLQRTPYLPALNYTAERIDPVLHRDARMRASNVEDWPVKAERRVSPTPRADASLCRGQPACGTASHHRGSTGLAQRAGGTTEKE